MELDHYGQRFYGLNIVYAVKATCKSLIAS